MYYDTDPTGTLLLALGSLLILGIILTFALISYIVTAIFLSYIFKKAKKPMWKAWIPFYNMWIVFELAGYKGWLYLILIGIPALLSPIPVLGFIVNIAAFIGFIIVSLNLQKAFNKDSIFILLYIFLPPVWLGILAFDRKPYNSKLLNKVEPSLLAK